MQAWEAVQIVGGEVHALARELIESGRYPADHSTARDLAAALVANRRGIDLAKVDWCADQVQA